MMRNSAGGKIGNEGEAHLINSSGERGHYSTQDVLIQIKITQIRIQQKVSLSTFFTFLELVSTCYSVKSR